MYGQEIEKFSQKWIQKFSQKGYRSIPFEQEFGLECAGLGFRMDHGRSLKEAAPDLSALTKLEDLKKIISRLTDLQLLGDALHSKWVLISDASDCALSRDDRQ